MKKFIRSWELLPLALVGISIVALIPWIETRAAFPDEPFDVSVIYRSIEGDIEYFPLIAQLSRGEVTDRTLKESAGERLSSFPHATLIPHAFFLALFGAYGFPIADVVLSACYLLALTAFFRTLGSSRATSVIAGLFVTLPIPFALSVDLDVGTMRSSVPLISELWGARIPRPFVSEIYLLLTFTAAARLLLRPVESARWLALAAALGLLVQGDLHSAILFSLTTPMLLWFVTRNWEWSQISRNMGSAALLFALVISPFAAQRLLEHADVPPRFGVFELDRLAGFLQTPWLGAVRPGFTSLCVVILARHLWADRRRRAAGEPLAPFEELSGYLVSVLLASFLAQGLSVMLLGKTVQPYHFDNRLAIVCTYVLLGVIVLTVERVVEGIAGGVVGKRVGPLLSRLTLFVAVAALLSGVIYYKLALRRQSTVFTGHLRAPYYSHTVGITPSYREGFSGLAKFLKSEVPSDAVVASFDHQVFAWWMTFSDGYSFLAEPFVSSAPDVEVETRLALLCRTLGVSPDEFAKFVQSRSTDLFWLGAAKHQASQWSMYSDISDYTDLQRAAILESDDVWQTFVPQSVVKRLRQQFEQLSPDDFDRRDLDVIVLTNSDRESPLVPRSDEWQLVFNNDAFRVYSRPGNSSSGEAL